MKKAFSLLLIFLPLVFIVTSCEHKEEDPIVKTTPYSKFKGVWSGSFTGSDSGTIDFSVKDDGSIVGTIESVEFPDSDLTLKGKVTLEGVVNIELIYLGDKKAGEFVGTMTETNAYGEWDNKFSGRNGTWTAAKYKK